MEFRCGIWSLIILHHLKVATKREFDPYVKLIF